MEKKLRVGILGATGMVGQRFISLLENRGSNSSSKPAFRRKDIRRGSRRTMENGYTNAGRREETDRKECK